MEIISESDFRKKIVKSKPAGYLFFGSEDYLKSFALKTARDTVCPDISLAPFNDIKLDGSDLTPDILLGALTTLPMMSDVKLIEISGMIFKDMKAPLIDEYCSVLGMLEEYDYNTVIITVPANGIDEGYLPKRPSAVLKKLGECLTPVYFEESTPLMLSRWVGRHFTANGVRADSAVCASLIEYCGTDMYRLAAETDKISWYVLSHGRDTVEPEDIKPVAVADTDFDSFAFTNAIMQNDRASALVILSEMKRRRTEPTVIMGEVIRVVCDMLTVRTLSESGATPAEIASKLKIHEYRVKLCLRNGGNTVRQKKVLALCADADEALKRSMQNGYAVIEQLICSL